MPVPGREERSKKPHKLILLLESSASDVPGSSTDWSTPVGRRLAGQSVGQIDQFYRTYVEQIFRRFGSLAVRSERTTMRVIRTTAVIVIYLSSLAAAEKITSRLVQAPDEDLETNVGGVVFRVDRQSPLPNIIGKPDIFGRKVDRGFVELRFKGLSPDGTLTFELKDVETRSNETTMNRDQAEVTRSTANVTATGTSTGVISQSTARGTVQSTTVRSQVGTNEMLPPDTTRFTVDPAKRKEFKIGDVTVQLGSADEVSLKYRLLWAGPRKKK